MPPSARRQWKGKLEDLTELYHALCKYPHSHLDNNALTKLQIQPPTSLGETGSQFFEPFNRETFDELWAQTEEYDPEVEHELPDLSDENNSYAAYHTADFLHGLCGTYPAGKKMLYEYGPWRFRYTDNTRVEKCLSYNRQSGHDCVTVYVFDNDDLFTPHIGCATREDADLDDRLLWSEVHSAVCFMGRRLGLKEYESHQVVPVFVITFSGSKARVLQAHFDTRLILQKSDVIELGKQNPDGIKYLLRWMMCRPRGKTM